MSEEEKSRAEYSRENYEVAEAIHDTAKSDVEVGKKQLYGNGLEYWASTLPYDLKLSEAESKLKELLADGQEDAEALNAEYERLKNDAQTSLEELHKFEVEKLGMKEEKAE